jgi:hypothetical protein
MIELLFFNVIYFILLNRFNTSSSTKILINLLINLSYIIATNNSFLNIVEKFIFFMSILYLIINIYTIKYSSLRFLILKRLYSKKKMPSENWLYLDRKKRIETKKTFMRFELFFIINIFVKSLKKIIL